MKKYKYRDIFNVHHKAEYNILPKTTTTNAVHHFRTILYFR